SVRKSSALQITFARNFACLVKSHGDLQLPPSLQKAVRTSAWSDLHNARQCYSSRRHNRSRPRRLVSSRAFRTPFVSVSTTMMEAVPCASLPCPRDGESPGELDLNCRCHEYFQKIYTRP